MLPTTKNSSYNLSSPFILYLCHTLKIYKPKYYKTMAQELEQPIYVKPNLIAENGKPFQGNLECFFTLYC